MTDDEVIKEFIHVERKENALVFYATIIEWEGSHTPVSEPVEVYRSEELLNEKEIQNRVMEITRMRSFFLRCTECGELNPVGWMHDEKICQGCAQMNHGIIY